MRLELYTPPPAPPAPIRLSKMEIEVLRVVFEGHSSQQAADLLFLSKRTIEFHLGNVYDKLEVRNRLQAFRRVLREPRQCPQCVAI